MDFNISDVSLSFINLYEEYIDYLVASKKLKVKRVPKYGHTKLYKKIRENNQSKKRFEQFLYYFEKVLRSNFRPEFLHNFDDNIEDLELISLCFQLADLFKRCQKYGGMYDVKKNKMFINIKDGKEYLSIYHELFHLASTNRMITSHIQTGFRVVRKGIDIGKGLNEGYTDLMAYRYFGNVGYLPGYPTMFSYSLALEQIVGRERMEQYYLTSNPNALVNDLQRYDSMDNIVEFIKLLDYTMDLNDSIAVEANRANSITEFLLKWYVRKAILDGENIYDPKVKNRIISYANQLPSKIEYSSSNSIKININAILDKVVDETMHAYSNNYRRF